MVTTHWWSRSRRCGFHARTDANTFVGKAKTVTIRHAGDHSLIAMVEVVSPGNKNSRRRFDSFVHTAEEALAAGIHLLIADLFPPTPRDPESIHRAIWQDRDDEFVFSSEKQFTCVSYVSDPIAEAFVEPIGLGDKLPEMPLFLTTEVYVPLPLETTYESAWHEVPAYWRDVVAKT